MPANLHRIPARHTRAPVLRVGCRGRELFRSEAPLDSPTGLSAGVGSFSWVSRPLLLSARGLGVPGAASQGGSVCLMAWRAARRAAWGASGRPLGSSRAPRRRCSSQTEQWGSWETLQAYGASDPPPLLSLSPPSSPALPASARSRSHQPGGLCGRRVAFRPGAGRAAALRRVPRLVRQPRRHDARRYPGQRGLEGWRGL